MHVTTVSVNERLFEMPFGDDLPVLEELARGVRRLSVVVATRTQREPIEIAPAATLIPVPARSRARGVARLVRRLIDLHRSDPIDVIQAQEPYYTGMAAAVAARLTGSALVVCVFGVDPADPGFRGTSPWHTLAAPVGGRVLKRADRVQTDSTIMADRLAARGLPVRYKPMTPLSLGRFLKAGEMRTHREIATTVLWVGRLGRQKNLGLLLDAFAIARRVQPGCRLMIVGDGPDLPLVKRRIDAHGLGGAVELVGARPQLALIDAYMAADVLALSSRFEGMPRVLLEASATGLPIVSTPVAGALELAQSAPVTIAEDTPEALGVALCELLLDREARRRAGRALRRAAGARLAGPPPPRLQLDVWREAVA
jgi:glycosyltransferase involved in cell wall biosynthesis